MNIEPQTEAPADPEPQVSWTDQDEAVLNSVERFLADGLALKAWWEQADAGGGYAEQFDLVHTLHRPDRSFGFFGSAPLERGSMPVMGVVDEVFYDQPKSPGTSRADTARWTKDQVREFVMRYFMRISDFRLPQEVAEPGGLDLPAYLSALSWRPREEVERKGMGFFQVYYKRRGTGEIGKFPEETAQAIVDLREVGETYEWIVVRLRVHDFTVTLKPFGPDALRLVVPLKEESYLILTPDFITCRDNPEPGVLGDYGLGYAFIKNPARGMFAYGPGEFEAAFQTIRFRVLETGETRVRMAFVSDQPDKIVNLTFDPVDWTFSVADAVSFGLTSRFFGPVKDALGRLPLRGGNVDPTLPSISLLNTLTDGQAEQQLGISRKHLYRGFLSKHSLQHYQTLLGSLRTWRQVPDWLDDAALPEWVVTGMSS